MKMKFVVAAVGMMTMTLIGQGCAHTAVEKRIDQKVAQETEVKNRSDVSRETKTRIENAPGLTQDQRSKLLALQSSIHAQMDDYLNQSIRLRSVLVQDLISSEYDRAEVQRVEQRIKNIEDSRVALIFDAADKANAILGREARTDNKMMIDDVINSRY